MNPKYTWALVKSHYRTSVQVFLLCRRLPEIFWGYKYSKYGWANCDFPSYLLMSPNVQSCPRSLQTATLSSLATAHSLLGCQSPGPQASCSSTWGLLEMHVLRFHLELPGRNPGPGGWASCALILRWWFWCMQKNHWYKPILAILLSFPRNRQVIPSWSIKPEW